MDIYMDKYIYIYKQHTYIYPIFLRRKNYSFCNLLKVRNSVFLLASWRKVEKTT